MHRLSRYASRGNFSFLSTAPGTTNHYFPPRVIRLGRTTTARADHIKPRPGSSAVNQYGGGGRNARKFATLRARAMCSNRFGDVVRPTLGYILLTVHVQVLTIYVFIHTTAFVIMDVRREKHKTQNTFAHIAAITYYPVRIHIYI